MSFRETFLACVSCAARSVCVPVLVSTGTHRGAALRFWHLSRRGPSPGTLLYPNMAGAPPAGGGAPAPPAALAAPAVAHGFTRCNIPGADNTLDYVYAPSGAKLISAFPKLGWVDASSVAPGCKAAPALAVQGVTCCSAFGDWDGAALPPALPLSELTASFSPAYMSRAADALDGLGLLDRAHHHLQSFLDALEVALPRVPSP